MIEIKDEGPAPPTEEYQQSPRNLTGSDQTGIHATVARADRGTPPCAPREAPRDSKQLCSWIYGG